ncbi:hypothetical protein HG530_010780 [Fusarium avenaceum]|nr:hypothetical protein HG530_010780 [Fusarium avenaceum]
MTRKDPDTLAPSDRVTANSAVRSDALGVVLVELRAGGTRRTLGRSCEVLSATLTVHLNGGRATGGRILGGNGRRRRLAGGRLGGILLNIILTVSGGNGLSLCLCNGLDLLIVINFGNALLLLRGRFGSGLRGVGLGDSIRCSLGSSLGCSLRSCGCSLGGIIAGLGVTSRGRTGAGANVGGAGVGNNKRGNLAGGNRSDDVVLVLSKGIEAALIAHDGEVTAASSRVRLTSTAESRLASSSSTLIRNEKGANGSTLLGYRSVNAVEDVTLDDSIGALVSVESMTLHVLEVVVGSVEVTVGARLAKLGGSAGNVVEVVAVESNLVALTVEHHGPVVVAVAGRRGVGDAIELGVGDVGDLYALDDNVAGSLLEGKTLSVQDSLTVTNDTLVATNREGLSTSNIVGDRADSDVITATARQVSQVELTTVGSTAALAVTAGAGLNVSSEVKLLVDVDNTGRIVGEKLGELFGGSRSDSFALTTSDTGGETVRLARDGLSRGRGGSGQKSSERLQTHVEEKNM